MGDSGDVSAATPSGSSSSTSLASSTQRSKSVVGATQVAGRRKRGTCVCPICNETIVDTTKNKKGHDAIFCEGICDSWLHRRCAGLSQPAFTELQNSAESFVCLHCQLKLCKSEISNLWRTVHSLQDSVARLESKLANSQPVPVQSVKPVANKPVPNVTSVQSSNQLTNPAQSILSDRKFNLVIKGIKEPSSGTARSERYKHDFNEALSLLSKLDGDIHPMSVRDCFRLGKFKANSRYPRPILVKLTRSMDVHSILSQRSNLPEGIVIKPDLSIAERKSESLLLKERFCLIQSGTDKRDIKIRLPILYLRGKKYAEVVNSTLVKTPSSAHSVSEVNSANTSPSSDSTEHVPSSNPIASPSSSHI